MDTILILVGLLILAIPDIVKTVGVVILLVIAILMERGVFHLASLLLPLGIAG